MNLNFYFDESGYKAKLSKGQPSNTKFCLIAGIAILSENSTIYSHILRRIFQNIKLEEGVKLHATEIFKDHKHSSIKEDFIEFIKHNDFHILHSVIHCIDFYNEIKDLKESSRMTSSTSIKPSGEHEDNGYYKEAFTEVIIKVDEFSRSNHVTNVRLISDEIDPSVEKECNEILKAINKNEYRHVYKGFDTDKKIPVERGSILIQVIEPNLSVNHTKELTIDHENSELTIAADIINNLIYRHIEYKIDTGFIGNLKSRELFNDFPLKDKIAFL